MSNRKNKFVANACLERPIVLKDLKKLSLEESLALEKLIKHARHLKENEKEFAKRLKDVKQMFSENLK
ncbi:hypothetical protein [Flavobacterium xanthum]|uniref:Uncharacterized protein n=1 Tax=Flavobacterium xanthum TaxID=69322 RepID=A0A1M7I5E9_9FLAO|nr:hypothetical protein [Flavobacterium xanthum]SHM35753.1 hypothetical protein SAMN05443669_103222 [Flavobacterium xanthum]